MFASKGEITPPWGVPDADLKYRPLSSTPTSATHTYRDVPFTLCPMMWDKVSGPFRKTDTPRERAHKDGILISLEQPRSI